MVKKASRRSRRSNSTRIRSVGPAAQQNYLRRAQQTLQAMQHSADKGNWAAVAAIAPVCAIAAADAVVAHVAGIVAKDADHAMAVELLLAHGGELDGVRQAAQHLRRLLERKTMAQYGERPITASMAQNMLTHAERLVAWVEGQLKDPFK